MPHAAPDRPAGVRFGPFGLDLRSGELSKNGACTRLQDQPLALLRCLLEHPGQLVTRDELRRRLCPNTTIVDFEHGVNTALKRLRDALGDSAGNPLYDVGLWVYDLGRETLTPLTIEGEVSWPTWDPDGQRVLFAWLKDGRSALAAQRADGGAPAEVLAEGEFAPSSMTPDGRQLAAMAWTKPATRFVTLQGRQARVSAGSRTPQPEVWPAFSPNGRWLAYGSSVSGRFEVYVRPHSGSGSAQVVSAEGGGSPAWHPNGRELFFVQGPAQGSSRRMMAVGFAPGPPPRLGRPRPLFDAGSPGAALLLWCDPIRCYDVAPDGQRFYALQSRTTPAGAGRGVTHINLVENWLEEVKARVPVTNR